MSLFDSIALRADTAFRVFLKTADGKQWTSPDGSVRAYIDVISSSSSAHADVQRHLAELRKQGRELSGDEAVRESMPFYVTGWLLLNPAGAPLDIPCTKENVRALFLDRRCDYFTAAAISAVVEPSNFTPALPSA